MNTTKDIIYNHLKIPKPPKISIPYKAVTHDRKFKGGVKGRFYKHMSTYEIHTGTMGIFKTNCHPEVTTDIQKALNFNEGAIPDYNNYADTSAGRAAIEKQAEIQLSNFKIVEINLSNCVHALSVLKKEVGKNKHEKRGFLTDEELLMLFKSIMVDVDFGELV